MRRHNRRQRHRRRPQSQLPRPPQVPLLSLRHKQRRHQSRRNQRHPLLLLLLSLPQNVNAPRKLSRARYAAPRSR